MRMGQNALRWTLLLAVLVTLTGRIGIAAATESGYYLAGLGLHEETGRNIYLGGIYLDSNTPRPRSLTELSGPWAMEYRVVARRTSIRSLLGGMLLQSEVATGQAPDQATTDFADAILSTVSTPLYAGDALVIRLTPNGSTSALLDGHELVRVANARVANYLLQGWIGETGPTTSFRTDLLAVSVNPSLLATLKGNTFSAEREAQVAAWFEPLDPAAETGERSAAADTELANATQDEPAVLPTEGELTATTAAPVAAPTTISAAPVMPATAPDIASAEPVLPTTASEAATATAEALADLADAEQAVAPEKTTETQLAEEPAVTEAPVVASVTEPVRAPIEQGQPEPEFVEQEAAVSTATIGAEVLGLATDVPLSSATGADALQVASLTPIASVFRSSSSEVLTLGVQEYAQRLTEFHSGMMAMVYKQIHYPARAIRRSLEGRVELDVTLQKSGELLAITVAQSSGHSMLDAAAVKAAEGAFSAGLLQGIDPVAIAEFSGEGDTVIVPVPISFKLTE